MVVCAISFHALLASARRPWEVSAAKDRIETAEELVREEFTSKYENALDIPKQDSKQVASEVDLVCDAFLP